VGKSKMSGHDIEIFEHLKRENRELKRQLKGLRKSLDRLDYEHLNELIESHENSEAKLNEKIEYTSKRERNETNWSCFDCQKGILRLIIIQKPNESIYFRRCDHCGKRTKTQHYTDKVEGVK